MEGTDDGMCALRLAASQGDVQAALAVQLLCQLDMFNSGESSESSEDAEGKDSQTERRDQPLASRLHEKEGNMAVGAGADCAAGGPTADKVGSHDPAKDSTQQAIQAMKEASIASGSLPLAQGGAPPDAAAIRCSDQRHTPAQQQQQHQSPDPSPQPHMQPEGPSTATKQQHTAGGKAVRSLSSSSDGALGPQPMPAVLPAMVQDPSANKQTSMVPLQVASQGHQSMSANVQLLTPTTLDDPSVEAAAEALDSAHAASLPSQVPHFSKPPMRQLQSAASRRAALALTPAPQASAPQLPAPQASPGKAKRGQPRSLLEEQTKAAASPPERRHTRVVTRNATHAAAADVMQGNAGAGALPVTAAAPQLPGIEAPPNVLNPPTTNVTTAPMNLGAIAVTHSPAGTAAAACTPGVAALTRVADGTASDAAPVAAGPAPSHAVSNADHQTSPCADTAACTIPAPSASTAGGPDMASIAAGVSPAAAVSIAGVDAVLAAAIQDAAPSPLEHASMDTDNNKEISTDTDDVPIMAIVHRSQIGSKGAHDRDAVMPVQLEHKEESVGAAAAAAGGAVADPLPVTNSSKPPIPRVSPTPSVAGPACTAMPTQPSDADAEMDHMGGHAGAPGQAQSEDETGLDAAVTDAPIAAAPPSTSVGADRADDAVLEDWVTGSAAVENAAAATTDTAADGRLGVRMVEPTPAAATAGGVDGSMSVSSDTSTGPMVQGGQLVGLRISAAFGDYGMCDGTIIDYNPSRGRMPFRVTYDEEEDVERCSFTTDLLTMLTRSGPRAVTWISPKPTGVLQEHTTAAAAGAVSTHMARRASAGLQPSISDPRVTALNTVVLGAVLGGTGVAASGVVSEGGFVQVPPLPGSGTASCLGDTLFPQREAVQGVSTDRLHLVAADSAAGTASAPGPDPSTVSASAGPGPEPQSAPADSLRPAPVRAPSGAKRVRAGERVLRGEELVGLHIWTNTGKADAYYGSVAAYSPLKHPNLPFRIQYDDDVTERARFSSDLNTMHAKHATRKVTWIGPEPQGRLQQTEARQVQPAIGPASHAQAPTSQHVSAEADPTGDVTLKPTGRGKANRSRSPKAAGSGPGAGQQVQGGQASAGQHGVSMESAEAQDHALGAPGVVYGMQLLGLRLRADFGKAGKFDGIVAKHDVKRPHVPFRIQYDDDDTEWCNFDPTMRMLFTKAGAGTQGQYITRLVSWLSPVPQGMLQPLGQQAPGASSQAAQGLGKPRSPRTSPILHAGHVRASMGMGYADDPLGAMQGMPASPSRRVAQILPGGHVAVASATSGQTVTALAAAGSTTGLFSAVSAERAAMVTAAPSTTVVGSVSVNHAEHAAATVTATGGVNVTIAGTEKEKDVSSCKKEPGGSKHPSQAVGELPRTRGRTDSAGRDPLFMFVLQDRILERDYLPIEVEAVLPIMQHLGLQLGVVGHVDLVRVLCLPTVAPDANTTTASAASDVRLSACISVPGITLKCFASRLQPGAAFYRLRGVGRGLLAVGIVHGSRLAVELVQLPAALRLGAEASATHSNSQASAKGATTNVRGTAGLSKDAPVPLMGGLLERAACGSAGEGAGSHAENASMQALLLRVVGDE